MSINKTGRFGTRKREVYSDLPLYLESIRKISNKIFFTVKYFGYIYYMENQITKPKCQHVRTYVAVRHVSGLTLVKCSDCGCAVN